MKRKRMDFDGGHGDRGFGRGPEGQDDIETPPATLRVLIRQSVSRCHEGQWCREGNVGAAKCAPIC